MITWLEIVDTAIKIGLGAMIAGGFSFLKDKMQEKKEKRRFYLERNHQIILSVSGKISEFHEQFRNCVTNKIQDPRVKFEVMWSKIGLITEAGTYLLFLGLEDSHKMLISYINKCEEYIGLSEQMIIRGADGYQNRVEPQYQELVDFYGSLIKLLKIDFERLN